MLEIIDMDLSHLDEVYVIECQSFAIPWTKNDLRKEMSENKHATYKVAINGDKIAGYAGMWQVVNEGHITNIAVSENHRRLGIASKLIEALTAHAKAQTLIGLTLEVRVSNEAAINLYKKYGFKPEGIRKEYYADTREDALLMWKYF